MLSLQTRVQIIHSLIPAMLNARLLSHHLPHEASYIPLWHHNYLRIGDIRTKQIASYLLSRVIGKTREALGVNRGIREEWICVDLILLPRLTLAVMIGQM